MKRNLFFCAMLCTLFTSVAWANGSIGAAIQREKQQNEFVPVNGMWSNDVVFQQAKAEPLVSNVRALVVDDAMKSRLMAEQPAYITLSVPNQLGGYYEVELMKYSPLSQGFKVATNANGVATDFEYTPGVYYRGIVKDAPGSIAAISFFNDKIYGIFSIPSVGDVLLVPNTLEQPVTGKKYLVYSEMDVKNKSNMGMCGTHPGMLPDLGLNGGGKAKGVQSTCKQVDEFIRGDFDTYNDFGGNSAGITNFSDYITAVYNMVSTLYKDEGVLVGIKRIEMNTTPDVYETIWPKDSKSYLDEMNTEMPNLFGADLGMIVTSVNGNMGGIAWLNGLCAPAGGSNHGPYAFCNLDIDFMGGSTMPTFNWDIKVMAHEMGHNLGSNHTHDCLWNGNNTAIDGCVTSPGSCPDGPIPSSGTIMSYCHLMWGVGVNLHNGFGPQPAQVIKDFVENSSCARELAVTVLKEANKSIVANSECTDNGITYYWNDKNTANRSDDQLILGIGKNANDIGDVEDAGFFVYASTTADYGNGTGKAVIMPAGTKGVGNAVAGGRFWQVKATKQPTTPVDILFPATKKDVKDIDGGMAANVQFSDLGLYSLTGDFNPSPVNLSSLSSQNFDVYTYSTGYNNVKWTDETIVADTFMMKMTTRALYGGGMYGVVSFPTDVNDVNSNAVHIYPNPASREWAVVMPATAGNTILTLFAADGRIVKTQELKAAVVNTVNAEDLAAGLYLYRITGDVNYTGTLNKQ